MTDLPEPIELKQPIAICNEHIASSATILRVRKILIDTYLMSRYDFTISTYPNHRGFDQGQKLLLSVESEIGHRSQRRHFRNADGLPIFSVSMKGSSATWLAQSPGDSTSKPMAVFAPRWDWFTNKMHVYVMNSADTNQAEVKLEVRGQHIYHKLTTEVYHDGALVMSAKVSMNDIKHSEWVVKVAKGFDVSLVGLLDWLLRASTNVLFIRHRQFCLSPRGIPLRKFGRRTMERVTLVLRMLSWWHNGVLIINSNNNNSNSNIVSRSSTKHIP